MTQTANATLPIFHMPSMFLAALNGIRAQNYALSAAASVDPDDGETTICLYRGPNNTRCAFGHSLPDEHFLPRHEGQGAHIVMQDLAVTHGKLAVYGSKDPDEILRLHDLANTLQRAHDDILKDEGVYAWENEMKIIAQQWGIPQLYTPVPQPTTEGATM